MVYLSNLQVVKSSCHQVVTSVFQQVVKSSGPEVVKISGQQLFFYRQVVMSPGVVGSQVNRSRVNKYSRVPNLTSEGLCFSIKR